MKYLSILFIILFLVLESYSQQANDILGTYHLPNELEVLIYKNGDVYNGRITSVDGFNDGQTKDYKNPDKSKRNDKLVGMNIITELSFDNETKQWINGKMYGPGKGMIFNLKVNEVLDNEIEVVGSKYFFWKTMKWARI